MLDQLPALQVVVPLLAAPLALVARREAIAWVLTTAASWVALAIAATLLTQVLGGGPISYAMGDWAPPWGIEYYVDTLNAFVLVMVAGIGAVVAPYARQSVLAEVGARGAAPFYTAFLLAQTGLLGITITGDAFNVFVFLEISSLASYILIAMGRDRRALTAAYQYLIMGTIGGTFVLIAVGFLYASTGTLNMQDLANRLPDLWDSRTVQVAFAFMTVGLSLKVALFPLHLWLPGAYTHAPSAVTVLLAATATKVAVYLMLRFAVTVFGLEFAFTGMPLGEILIPLGCVAMVVASLSAIFQDDVKTMFAYSSIAQIGYIVMAIGLASAAGFTAALVHLFNHAVIKGALFMALGCVMWRLGSVNIADMAGIARRMPWTMAAFVVGSLSLIGVPLTAGFISKWYLLLATLDAGYWPLAVLIVFTSLLAVIYCWRVVEAAYLTEPVRRAAGADQTGGVAEAPLSMLAPTWALIAVNFYLGLETTLTVGTAQRAAAALMGGGS